jgi:predicted ferric reductase
LNGHFSFQGGILKYHQWITLFTGFLLIDFAFRFQQGAWIYFYLLGMGKVVKDTLKNNGEKLRHEPKALELQPLTYYAMGMIVAVILWVQIGAGLPDMTLGIIESTTEVITE